MPANRRGLAHRPAGRPARRRRRASCRWSAPRQGAARGHRRRGRRSRCPRRWHSEVGVHARRDEVRRRRRRRRCGRACRAPTIARRTGREKAEVVDLLGNGRRARWAAGWTACRRRRQPGPAAGPGCRGDARRRHRLDSPQADRNSASARGSMLPPLMTTTRWSSPGGCGAAPDKVGGHGRGARGLDHETRASGQAPNGVDHLLLAHGHDLVHISPQMHEWKAPKMLHPQPVGHGTGGQTGVPMDHLTGGQRTRAHRPPAQARPRSRAPAAPGS